MQFGQMLQKIPGVISMQVEICHALTSCPPNGVEQRGQESQK